MSADNIFDISQDEILSLLAQKDHLDEEDTFPVIPLRDMVILPEVLLVIFVARKTSIRMINKYKDQPLLFVLQKDTEIESPTSKDLYQTGTIARIIQTIDVDSKIVKILVQGYKRAQIADLTVNEDSSLMAKVKLLHDIEPEYTDCTEKVRALNDCFIEYHKLKKQHTAELKEFIKSDKSPSVFADLVTAYIDLEADQKQVLLEELHVIKRIELLIEFIKQENEKIKISNKISKDVKTQVMNSQKEFFLRTQLNAIKKELGDTDSLEDDIEDFSKKLKTTALSEEAKDKASKEIKKLKTMNSMSAEASIVRNYLDWIFALPWGKYRKLNNNFEESKKILEQNHYGLHKIKERIYEMFALQSRTKSVKGSILCFYGPPGVGKTSLAKSIAAATGRDFVRISLGGLYDEAEIRGHRSTYIGAKPGRIIQALRNAKSNNLLVLLDEIGEIGQDNRGNPAGALLELLDTEQNNEFRDNFMEIGWDFSKTLFIASTNSLDLTPALVDRLEIINIPGYTEDEKLHIAIKHLIPKQKAINALADHELSITDETIRKLIRQYTREAGVRNLEREIANLCRKALVKLVDKTDITANNVAQSDTDNARLTDSTLKKKTMKKSTIIQKSITITPTNLHEYAGTYKYVDGAAELKDRIGVCTGLAWTQAGGDILYIETVISPGSGQVITTGNLGKTMEQSATAAVSYVRSRAQQYNLDPKIFKETDIHIHVPEGAIPKDGPSAGIAICTALVSAFTKRPVRGDIAMTGELSLRNLALPIGGLKEKLLAAMRGNIKTVFIPKANQKDLDDIRKELELTLEVIAHDEMSYIIEHALSEHNI